MNTLAHSKFSSPRALKIVLAALLSTFMFALPVTAFAEKSKSGIYHSWIMRGQVLSAEAGKGIICIGKRDKAKVGDVLNVVRQTPVVGGRASGFRPVDVGQVRLTSIVDDHYSEYEVVKGEPQVNDTVELERK